MIDKEKFLTGIALLAGAFGREVDGPVQAAYYRVLNPQMTTAEYERAIDLTLKSETFWPSPATILGKVAKGGAALSALEQVTAAINAAGGHRFMTFAQYDAFDDATKRAIMACGGLPKIATCSEEKWPAMQRKFAQAFDAPPVDPNQLAATGTDGRPDPRVKQLVGSVANRLSGRDRAAGEVEGVEP